MLFDPLELFVDLQNAAELLIEGRAWDMGDVEIHAHAVLLDAQAFVGADVENFACGDIARRSVRIRMNFPAT